MRSALTLLMVVVSCAVSLFVSSSAAAQPSAPTLTPIYPRGWLTADHDAHADRLVRDPGWRHDGPVYGRVLVVSGATGAPARILVGQEAGDLFGIAACPMGDLTGDGLDEIAVGAPGAYTKTDAGGIPRGVADDSALPERYGRVVLIDGASGLTLATFAGNDSEFYGFGICRIADADGDGADDMIVLSVSPSPGSVQGLPIWRYTVQSTASGAVVSTGLAADLEATLGGGWQLGLWNAESPLRVRKRQLSDLNADGVVDGADLLEVMANLGQSGGNIGRGDVDLSGVITPEDVAGIIQEYGATMPPEYIAATGSASAVPCRRSGGPNPRCPMCFLGPGGCSDPDGGGDGGGGDGGDGGGGDGGQGPGGGGGGTTQPPGFDDPGVGGPPDDCGGAAIHTDLLTDSNNDSLINPSDEDVETDDPGRLIAVYHEEGPLPRDVAQVQVRAVPTGCSSWRVVYGATRISVFKPGMTDPVPAGVWQTGAPPATFSVHALEAGQSYFTLDCQTPNCGVRSDAVTFTCIDPVFEIDPEAQPEDDSYLAVLPADGSEIFVRHGVGGTPPITYTLSLEDAQFLNTEGEFVDTLPAAMDTDRLVVYSPKVGAGFIEVRRGTETGPIMAKFPFEVGGKIAVAYKQLPTFYVTQSGGTVNPVIGPSEPGPESGGSGGIQMGGGSYLGGGRGSVRPEAHDAANAMAAMTSTVRIAIRDARDNPIGKKFIRVIARHRRLEAASGTGGGPLDLAPINNGFTSSTDQDGISTIELAANSEQALDFYNRFPSQRPDVPWSEQSLQVEQMGVFIGLSGEVERLPGAETRETFFNDGTRAIGNLKYKSSSGFTMDTVLAPTEQEDNAWAFQSFQVPMVNHTHYMVLRAWLDGPPLVTPYDPGTVVTNIGVWDATGETLLEEQLTLSYVGMLSSLSPDQRALMLNTFRAASGGLEIEAGTPVTSADEVLSLLGGIGCGAAQIGFSFIPVIPDLIDFGKELIWNPLVAHQAPNWWVVGFSAFGLIADGGYLFLPAGVIGNVTATIGKFIARLEQRFPGLISGFVRFAGTVKQAAQMIADYASRIPAPPSGGVLEHATEIVTKMARQIARIITLPDMLMERAVDAIKIVWRRTGPDWSDDAVEGVGRLCKRCFPSPTAANDGCGGFVEAILRNYPDDVAREAMSLVKKLPDSPHITPDAIEGLAVSLKAVGTNNRHIVDELIQGTQMTAERLGKALSGFKQLDGTAGLDELVKYVRNNRNNADGVDGAVFEVTTAVQLRNANWVDAGALQRVSADGLPNSNKIDTLCENWAIQVKHKRDPQGVFVPSDLHGGGVSGTDYLDLLAEQASARLRTPVLFTNRPISPTLASALDARGILWRQTAD